MLQLLMTQQQVLEQTVVLEQTTSCLGGLTVKAHEEDLRSVSAHVLDIALVGDTWLPGIGLDGPPALGFFLIACAPGGAIVCVVSAVVGA